MLDFTVGTNPANLLDYKQNLSGKSRRPWPLVFRGGRPGTVFTGSSKPQISPKSAAKVLRHASTNQSSLHMYLISRIVHAHPSEGSFTAGISGLFGHYATPDSSCSSISGQLSNWPTHAPGHQPKLSSSTPSTKAAAFQPGQALTPCHQLPPLHAKGPAPPPDSADCHAWLPESSMQEDRSAPRLTRCPEPPTLGPGAYGGMESSARLNPGGFMGRIIPGQQAEHWPLEVRRSIQGLTTSSPTKGTDPPPRAKHSPAPEVLLRGAVTSVKITDCYYYYSVLEGNQEEKTAGALFPPFRDGKSNPLGLARTSYERKLEAE